MNVNNPFPPVLFWLAFAGAIGWVAFNIIRRGGVKAAFFNAKISGTTGEVGARGPKLVNQTIKVHTLDRDGEPLVGMAVTSKTFLSYQMLPVVLSREQAQELSALLKSAAGTT